MERVMGVLNNLSLAQTLDNLNEAFYNGTNISPAEKIAVVRWITGRQGLAGSYHGLFAPTSDDLVNPVWLFTGEKIESRVGTSHILGEEASRALLILNVPLGDFQLVWQKANSNMLEWLHEYETRNNSPGMYCCGNCSPAYWRNIAAGGLDRQQERLESGMQALKALRTGDGLWRTFPYYYSLLAILDIKLKSALEEMRYTAPLLEKRLKRLNGEDKYTKRRKALAEKVLARC
jgi:hypothetical protein